MGLSSVEAWRGPLPRRRQGGGLDEYKGNSGSALQHRAAEQTSDPRDQRPTSWPASSTSTMRTLFIITLVPLLYFMHVYSDGEPHPSAVCCESVCRSSCHMLSVCLSVHSAFSGRRSAWSVLFPRLQHVVQTGICGARSPHPPLPGRHHVSALTLSGVNF